METQDYASLRLRTDVIDRGLCPLCGGCTSGCPYIGEHNGRVILLDCCPLAEGSCYRNCPRTLTDLDELSDSVFSEPFSSDDLGIVRGAYLTRATDVDLSATDGGTTVALLCAALKEGLIEAVPCTGLSGDERTKLAARNLAAVPSSANAPVPVVLTTDTEVRDHVAQPYHTSRVLAAFNSIPKENQMHLGMACLPCQVASMRKRLSHPADSRADARNVRLLIGESCAAKRWLEPGEDRQSANKACSYCWDLTGELADISVGSGRGAQGWNIVFVRTSDGQAAFDAAMNSGAIESKPLPTESLEKEKKASRDKKRRAVKNLASLSGSRDDLMYLRPSSEIVKALEGSA